MASVLPSDRQGLIEFANVHAAVWSSAPATIGLTPAQVTAISNALESAIAGQNSVAVARTNSKTATSVFSENISDLRSSLSEAVRNIKAFAESSANPENIYNLAQIPSPSDRGPSVPPNRAYELAATLDISTGALSVRWKASQPQGVTGVVYQIRRAVTNTSGVTGDFSLVGAVGGKTFQDFTVPGGVRGVRYQIQAQRGTLTSPWSDTLEVNFGVAGFGGPGATGATFSTRTLTGNEQANMKMAA